MDATKGGSLPGKSGNAEKLKVKIRNAAGAVQEADESSLWLELLRKECDADPMLTKPLEDESRELIAIFTSMINHTRERGA